MSHLVYQLHNNYATYAEFDHLFFFFKAAERTLSSLSHIISL